MKSRSSPWQIASLRFAGTFLTKQTRRSNDKTKIELGYRRSIICYAFDYFGIAVGKLQELYLFTEFHYCSRTRSFNASQGKMTAVVKSTLGIPTLLLLSLFWPKKGTYLGKLVEGLCCQDEENVSGACRRYDSNLVSPHSLTA